MSCFTRIGVVEDMISLFGGVRFRQMDLFYTYGMRLLFDATAGTLETLRLYPNDPRSERVFLKKYVKGPTDNFSARTRHRDFDLSRSLSLRTLEVTMEALLSVDTPLSPGFTHALSTVKSPVFSDIVVTYEDGSVCGTKHPQIHGIFRHRSYESFMSVFDRLHQMREILDFGLVLCADVWGYGMEYTVRELEWNVSRQREQRRLGDFSRVSMTCSPRRSGHPYRDPFHPSRRYLYLSRVVPPF